MLLVPRICLPQADPEDGQPAKAIAIEETRGFSAYALLGDPGSGKSKAFEQEAAIYGVAPISAGDFLGLDHPALRDATFPIFIDGLDETRAGMTNGTVPLDGIRKKLQQLGCRRFRISCRAADWLGQSDAQRLQSLLSEGDIVRIFRLQPLTVADVEAILEANYGIANPTAFVAAADEHGLKELLFNPQTLEMLAKAVGTANRWPESRLAVYEMACVRLAQEHNQEHAAATRKIAPNQAALRSAAAYLCVLYLVADLAGFTRSNNPGDRVLALNAVPNPQGLPFDEAIASRLFKEVGQDVFIPAHRTVAEFLAAGYIADALSATLSLRRFLTMICGSDGGVVSSMRGLNAWLASLSSSARLTCSQLDPLGVLLYGDARNFSVNEKLMLIGFLDDGVASSPLLRWRDWDSKSFSPLVMPEMQEALKQRLIDQDRSEGSQLVAMALLGGLKLVPPAPALAPILLSMARGAEWWPALRLQALKLYIRWVGASEASVMELLEDVHGGRVQDEDDEFLGTLLDAMYPHALSSRLLPQFLHPPKKSNLIGRYTMFWRHSLVKVVVQELPVLLDAFAQRPELRRSEATRDYSKAVGALLARALNEVGDETGDERLLDWLDACCGKHATSLLEDDDGQTVRRWLEAHPQRYLSLLDLGLIRYWTGQARIWAAEARFHGAKVPWNMSTWWLAKAEATADDQSAKEYFLRAVHTIPEGLDPGLQFLLNECHRVANARGWQDEFSSALTCDLEQNSWRQEDAIRKKERQQEVNERHAYFRERLQDFALPMAPLEVLDPVAMVYEERAIDVDGDTPVARLNSLFAGDEELVQAALQALKNTIEREDLPTVEQTMEAIENGQVMTLNAPALIGLELRHREDPAFLDTLSNERLTAVLVAHLIHGREDGDSWVAAAVQRHPQNMADALTAYLRPALRSKNRSAHGTHLFRNREYRQVAERCLLPLLAGFPERAHPAARGSLSDLLHAALKLWGRVELAEIVRTRIEAPKMDGSQRAHWLAAGLLIDPDQYLPLVSCYIKRPRYMRQIAGFLHYRGDVYGEAIALPSNVLGVLLEHFAPGCTPARVTGAHWVSSAMSRADLVRQYINDLAGRADVESAAQLRRLEAMPELIEWAPKLRDARASQQIVRRDATFERPSWEQVCATLQQGTPTTSASIAAVVNDTIQDLKEQVRYSDLELHDQYWNTDAHGRPTEPRHEEVCRNTFSDQLRVRLERFGIGCLPETQHVDGKRSDVWCTAGLQGVPIEVKKDHHQELWTATKGQLMARYASDPRAKGRGIYVGFWFGQPSRIPVSPGGVRPETPQELETMLKTGLTEDELRAITIHVIDCSVR